MKWREKKKACKAGGIKLRHHALMPLPLVLVSFLTLFSCKNKTPDDVISSGKLEEILFDYHMAEAAEAGMPGDKGENKGVYVNAVFQKYGISKDEFSHSMAYYFRHTDKLSNIYAHLRERYGNLVADAGHALPDIGQTGDTINLWNGPSAYLLSSQTENRILYEVKADTSFHPKDRIVWTFKTRWMYHDGAKNMIAVVKAEYANDSVATSTRTLYSSGKQEISLTLADAPLRKIVCMLYLASGWTEKPRLAIVDMPVLLRARMAKLPFDDVITNTPPAVSDSLRRRSLREREIRDSLLMNENRSKKGNVPVNGNEPSHHN